MRAKIADFGLATIKTETMTRTTVSNAGQGTCQWMGKCFFTSISMMMMMLLLKRKNNEKKEREDEEGKKRWNDHFLFHCLIQFIIVLHH
jgi:hypothetical protein